MDFLKVNDIYCGSAEELMFWIKPDSIAVSVWSPPYHVGKKYENNQSYEEWTEWGSRAVWKIRSVQRNDDHEAKFPVELPRRVIKLFSDEGDVVLDCFMGSGTSAVAALMEKRHYIGIDKEEKYVQLAKKNIEQFSLQAAQMSLFEYGIVNSDEIIGE
ncbi:MAG: site-specific DNA-methyltransferase [Lachnospiraceae bacterium]|nr:site-specific DNA-methyltransferase [Lachnospiraceae bacterium]